MNSDFQLGLYWHYKLIKITMVGHGYGSLVSKAISKRIGELGDDSIACVSEHNSASRRLFEKLGFVLNETVYSLCTKIHWSDADEYNF